MDYLVSHEDSDLAAKHAKIMNPFTQKIKILPKNGIVVNGHFIGDRSLDDAYAEGYRYAYTLL